MGYPGGLGLPASMIWFSWRLQKCANSSFLALHLVPVLPLDYLELWPSQDCPASPRVVYLNHRVNLGLCVHLGSIAWLGTCLLTNVCLTLWEDEKRIFFALLDLTSHLALCNLLTEPGGILAAILLWPSGCQVLLTTVEAPFIYTIPRSPWN